jgi:hypothetical protein
VRFVDDAFPGWVAAELRDADGRIHTVIDKYPMFSCEILDADTSYPLAGAMRCRILESWHADGRDLVHIETPGVESVEGKSEFVVLRTQIASCA